MGNASPGGADEPARAAVGHHRRAERRADRRLLRREFGLAPEAGGWFSTLDVGRQLRLVSAPTRRLIELGVGADDADDLARVAGAGELPAPHVLAGTTAPRRGPWCLRHARGPTRAGYRPSCSGELSADQAKTPDYLAWPAIPVAISRTSGQASRWPLPGSGAISLVNAGLEGFVRAAALEAPSGIRVNAVSPPWLSETLSRLGMEGEGGLPASVVAQAYARAVERRR